MLPYPGCPTKQLECCQLELEEDDLIQEKVEIFAAAAFNREQKMAFCKEERNGTSIILKIRLKMKN